MRSRKISMLLFLLAQRQEKVSYIRFVVDLYFSFAIREFLLRFQYFNFWRLIPVLQQCLYIRRKSDY